MVDYGLSAAEIADPVLAQLWQQGQDAYRTHLAPLLDRIEALLEKQAWSRWA